MRNHITPVLGWRILASGVAREQSGGMLRTLIASGSPFETQASFSRAVVEGDMCFVAGTTGYDFTADSIPDDPGAQAANALATIARTLEQAGFAMTDVVRATYYIADPSCWDALAAETGKAFAGIMPAATCIVAALIRPEMKIEIEVTAKRRQA